jgi:hypothetical protein
MLKKILLVLVALVALIVGGAFLLPREITVTHTAQLDAAPDVLFPLISTPTEWPKWSAWNRRDPDMTITYSGPPTGVGARWDWKSAKEGDGFMVFTLSVPSAKVEYDLTIIGMGPPSHGDIQMAPNAKGTVVAWTQTFDMGNNPFGRWFGLYIPTMMRRDFTAGLEQLNEYSRNMPPSEPIMGREIPGAQLVPSDAPSVP